MVLSTPVRRLELVCRKVTLGFSNAVIQWQPTPAHPPRTLSLLGLEHSGVEHYALLLSLGILLS